jgi:hypothetical protein
VHQPACGLFIDSDKSNIQKPGACRGTCVCLCSKSDACASAAECRSISGNPKLHGTEGCNLALVVGDKAPQLVSVARSKDSVSIGKPTQKLSEGASVQPQNLALDGLNTALRDKSKFTGTDLTVDQVSQMIHSMQKLQTLTHKTEKGETRVYLLKGTLSEGSTIYIFYFQETQGLSVLQKSVEGTQTYTYDQLWSTADGSIPLQWFGRLYLASPRVSLDLSQEEKCHKDSGGDGLCLPSELKKAIEKALSG